MDQIQNRWYSKVFLFILNFDIQVQVGFPMHCSAVQELSFIIKSTWWAVVCHRDYSLRFWSLENLIQQRAQYTFRPFSCLLITCMCTGEWCSYTILFILLQNANKISHLEVLYCINRNKDDTAGSRLRLKPWAFGQISQVKAWSLQGSVSSINRNVLWTKTH